MIKVELYGCINEFYAKVILLKVIATSFLSLIPKTSNPREIVEFRPICLVGSVYRIIAKTLTRGLKKVVGSLVSLC